MPNSNKFDSSLSGLLGCAQETVGRGNKNNFNTTTSRGRFKMLYVRKKRENVNMQSVSVYYVKQKLCIF